MKELAVLAIGTYCAATLLTGARAADSPGPRASSPIVPIAAPKDRAYPGEIRLAVDASDFGRRIIRVHERISGIGPDTVLLYPKWLPGTHAPEGPIDRVANLRIAAQGVPIAWTRDPVDVYAFRVHAGPGIKFLDIDFEYLSPTNPQVGALEIGRDVLMIEWNELVLYPAGYFARQIPVQASLALPADWQYASALEADSPGASGAANTTGAEGAAGAASTTGAASATKSSSATSAATAASTTFKRVSLETLIDSAVYAGRYTARLDLDPGGSAPVHLDLFADRPQFLAVKSEQLEVYRVLVQQTYKLFGSHHFAHYDFLYSLSDEIQHMGLEHHQSSENGSDPESFTEWDKTAYVRDLLPHEFTHSWNGKFRRPADLWTPNYNVPMQNSLLWVYEGQTQYWGQVLAARSSIWTRQQAFDQLALTSAYYELHAGRQWRTLQDTTNDEIINPRRPQSWRNWQRFEDYYDEGALIWLDADTLIRERSKGRHSLDDFARSFFGIHDGDVTPVTYTFDDVVKALNAVEPYDWAVFLHQRLDSIAKPAPLDGLRRGGYKLVYSDTPSDYLKASEGQLKRVNLFFSIGVEMDDKDKEGSVSEVIWGSPAFKAQLTAGAQILAVDGVAYSADVLKDAIRAAQSRKSPIELIVKTADRFTVASLDYHDGLRYPHLERDASEPARLDDIVMARP